MNSHPAYRLEGSNRVSTGQTITTLLHRFDALRSFPPGQAFSCPADDGSQVLATLHYGGRHRVTISTSTGGCNVVTNGDLRRSAANLDNRNPQGPKLLAQLKRLTRG